MTEQNYFIDSPWTWRDRLRAKAFPIRFCPLPEPDFPSEDVLIITTRVSCSLLDRLRVLVGGGLCVETRTAVEHRVGRALTASVAYPCHPARAGGRP